MTNPIVPSVTYLFPVPPREAGPDERETRPLTQEPNPAREARSAPDEAFGFYYGDDVGQVHFIDGLVYDRSNVDQLPPEHQWAAADIAAGLAYVQLRGSSRLGSFGCCDMIVTTA